MTERRTKMEKFERINEKLEEFAQSVPDKGAHVGYLASAYELYRLYGKASAVMEEDDITAEDESKLEEISQEVEEIVG